MFSYFRFLIVRPGLDLLLGVKIYEYLRGGSGAGGNKVIKKFAVANTIVCVTYEIARFSFRQGWLKSEGEEPGGRIHLLCEQWICIHSL